MRLLFLDIETAPHLLFLWGLRNQFASINQIHTPGYTMCWSAKWKDTDEIMYDSIWDSKEGAKGMLLSIHDLLDEADAVCHFNGASFDIPTLDGEFLKHEFPPTSYYRQIDLYKTSKRFRTASRKLDYLAQYYGIGEKVHHHKGMDLWKGCMIGDKECQKTMEEYNKQDVVLLEPLYHKFLPYIKNHPNMGLYVDDQGEDAIVCHNCGSTDLIPDGFYPASTFWYPKYICNTCRSPLKGIKRIRRDFEHELTKPAS